MLKSGDPDLKFEKAIAYFNAAQYSKAQTLFDDVSGYYKGTERSEQVLIYLARCYMANKEYSEAADYYASYVRSYPKGQYNNEARFMLAHAYYMDSPDARLDQEQTNKAIQAYTQFLEMYPESPFAGQAYNELTEMNDKLAYKELLSARLYYNLGTYLGNNYLAAETVARNAMKKYPASTHQEEFDWIILQSKYKQAILSTEDQQSERVRDTEDEYYSFIAQHPESKHRREAETILKAIQKLKR